ncbi:hypothetical protein AYO44_00455 [Planctomycetaceae bacterium SCGC AG-212-F19]|nr:hypothetical protein AYO44_00455 [Planctomycetaceae bacterium SCGC AG-212-F19]
MLPRPDSRVYTHRGCGGKTIVSGDDYLILEFPYRSVTGTFCCKCNTFVPLGAVDWADTGENVGGYRQRLFAVATWWDHFRIGLFGNAVMYRPPPLDGIFGDPTHFRWFARPAPAQPPPPVQQVQGTGDGLPAEVTALGRADHMHYPWPILAQLHADAKPFALAGLIIIALCVAMVVAADHPLAKTIAVMGALLGVLALLTPLKTWRAIPIYAAFDSALVIIQGTQFTIIPWEAITEFNPGTGVLAAGETVFTIDSGVQQHGLLVQKIKDRVTNRLLPVALPALREEGSIDFGPLTLRRTGMDLEGKHLRWDEVKKVDLSDSFVGERTLYIHAKGSLLLPWAKIKLANLANEFIVIEVLRRNLPNDAPLNGA